MIIFGWRTRLQQLGQGIFLCPVEGGGRHGVLLQARRWFTLFFIPVIPLRITGRAVQCDSCGSYFGEAVLTHTVPAAQPGLPAPAPTVHQSQVGHVA